uniref:Uncharacterized protein n=1 Tax=Acrobeloides nanus TaxID=290746 RepID=A0A914DZ06_9BILA
MKILRIFNSTFSNGLKCSEVSRCLHVSTYSLNHFDKVENTKVIYELPEVLKKWEENSANHLKAELGGLRDDIEALQGDIKGGTKDVQGEIKALLDDLKGDIKGVQGEIKRVNKIAVYSVLAGTAIGFTLKAIYDSQ